MPKSIPDWALEMLAQLRQLEAYLGNMPPVEEEEDPETLSYLAKDLLQKTFATEANIDPRTADLLFQRIVRRLHKEGFTPEEIITLINQKVAYKGGPAYCDLSEVKAELS